MSSRGPRFGMGSEGGVGGGRYLSWSRMVVVYCHDPRETRPLLMLI